MESQESTAAWLADHALGHAAESLGLARDSLSALAPLRQKRERGAELGVSLEDFLEKLPRLIQIKIKIKTKIEANPVKSW